MEAFPELLGELCRNMSAVLVQFNFLQNIRRAVLAYCFVIKVLTDHHSLRSIVLRFTPWVRSGFVPSCKEGRV